MVLNLPRPRFSRAGPGSPPGLAWSSASFSGSRQAGPVAAADPAAMSSEAKATAGLVARLAAAPDPARLFRSLPSADQHSVTGYLSASRFTSSQQLGRRTSGGTATTQAPGQAPLRRSAAHGRCRLLDLEVGARRLQPDRPEAVGLLPGDRLVRRRPDVILGSPQVLSYGATWFPFWTWVHAGDRAWGGSGQATFRAWTQADFSLCLTPNIGCIQSTYPWLDMTAHANGTGTGSAG